jgi:hypothetical protein
MLVCLWNHFNQAKGDCFCRGIGIHRDGNEDLAIQVKGYNRFGVRGTAAMAQPVDRNLALVNVVEHDALAVVCAIVKHGVKGFQAIREQMPGVDLSRQHCRQEHHHVFCRSNDVARPERKAGPKIICRLFIFMTRGKVGREFSRQ